MTYREKQEDLIKNSNKIIKLYDLIQKSTKTVCYNIRLADTYEEQEFWISKDAPTFNTVKHIFRLHQLRPRPNGVSIEVHTSDIIGKYLNIYTNFGKFMICIKEENFEKFTQTVIKVGSWSRALNRYEPLGSWDKVRYQGGEHSLFPRKEYTKEEYLTQLKYLFDGDNPDN